MSLQRKVSVIIPTFRSGDGLAKVIESLDAQTLPTAEFEVIFVDDGSGDGTADRLREYAATRPHFSVMEIENSGWGSRPRNIGIGAAVGEYVTFMDHDDSLYPDALRAAYEAGARIGADFVNPKEVTNRGWSWGWDVWIADREITFREDMIPRDVTPLIPHKLYRREFLNEHGIRFPEGPRAFWEDFYVNTEVFVHAKSIAILSSVPFYKWHRETGSNSSDKLYESPAEYWSKLSEVARFMEERVPEPEARRWLMINHYRWWVLDLFGPRMLKRDPEFIAASLPFMLEFLQRWVPAEVENDLEQAWKAVSYLAHAGDLPRLIELAQRDQGVRALGRDTEVDWVDGALCITYGATWIDGNGDPILFRRVGDRIYRVLGADLESALPEAILDVTDAIAAGTGRLSLRSRADRIGWRVPSTSTVHLDDEGDGLVSVRIVVTGTIDPESVVFGKPLGDGVWDIGVRFELMGLLVHNAVKYTRRGVGSVSSTRSALAYSTSNDALALDVGNTLKSLSTGPRLAYKDAQAPRASGLFRRELSIPMKNVEGASSADLPVEVEFDGSIRVPGRLVASGRSVRLVVPMRLRAGVHTWRVVMNGVASPALRDLKVDSVGRVRFVEA